MKHYYNRTRIMALLLCALFLLSGCDDMADERDNLPSMIENEEEENKQEKPTLPEVLSLPYNSEQPMDPLTCPDGMHQVIGSLVYEGLFRLDQKFQPQPLLCKSYQYDAASLTYSFTLRSGVTFSDGTPLTGQDVKATLDRAQETDRYRSRLSGVKKITAAGDTVLVQLSAPNNGFPALLEIPIVKSGTEQTKTPIGTGPYLFSDNDCLVANQTWWQGNKQPTDRIELVESVDRDTMLYRFTSRDVQLITVDFTGEEPFTAAGDICFQDTDTTILQYIGCNIHHAPLDNAAFRNALWMGFNRATVIDAFLSGHGKAAQFPLSPACDLYPKELEQKYSIEAFTKALKKSEYTPGRTMTLVVNQENTFKVSVANYVAQTLTAAGIPVEVRPLPWEDYLSALKRGAFDFYYGEVKLSADWNLAPLLATGGSLNYGGWSDPNTDALLTAYAAASDREQAMKALCLHLKNQAPILPVCFKSTSVLTQAEVIEGLTPTSHEPFFDLKNSAVHLKK